MFRFDLSWDTRKQQIGQVDLNAGFTALSKHNLGTVYLASVLFGLAAAILSQRSLLWALELTLLSDVGNMFIIAALLPALTKSVKESKFTVTSAPGNCSVILVAPDAALDLIAALASLTMETALRAVLVYGFSSSLALIFLVTSFRSLVAIVRLVVPESVADSKGFNLVSCLVGLRLTQLISESFMDEQAKIEEPLIEGEVRSPKTDDKEEKEEEVSNVEVDSRVETVDETKVEEVTNNKEANYDEWIWIPRRV